MAGSHIVPAGQGRAVRVGAAERIRIGLPEGPQVADLFAFVSGHLSEFLSTEHTRSCLDGLAPHEGEAFYSNRRRPLLLLVEDSSPGVHDLLLSACDQQRYALLGHVGPHRSCVENLFEAMRELDLMPPEVPSPVNLFEKVAIGKGGKLTIQPPPAKRGDFVILEALVDLVVVVSACPMDIVPTNGTDLQPKSIAVEVWDSSIATPPPTFAKCNEGRVQNEY